MNTSAMLDADTEAIAKSRTFFDIQMKRLEWQHEDATFIDQKIGVWFQAAPVVTGLLLGLLGTLKTGLVGPALIVAGVGVVCFLAAMVVLLYAQNPRRFLRGTNWEHIAEYVNNRDLPASEFHYALAYTLANETLPKNLVKIEKKATLFVWAVRTFVVSNALLLVAAVIALGAIAVRH